MLICLLAICPWGMELQAVMDRAVELRAFITDTAARS